MPMQVVVPPADMPPRFRIPAVVGIVRGLKEGDWVYTDPWRRGKMKILTERLGYAS